MEYSSGKSFHRQRICVKCKSFVTPDKIDEQRFSCPLCGQGLPKAPNVQAPIGIQQFRMILAERFRKSRANRD